MDHRGTPQPDLVPRVTLVVPVFNEEASIAPFLDRVTQSTAAISGISFDILFVNDGSRDRTERLILAAAEKRGDVSLVNLSRNFGKEAALTAGLHHASGDAVIPLDVDLQDPPEVMAEMIRRWQAGACRAAQMPASSRPAAAAAAIWRCWAGSARWMPSNTTLWPVPRRGRNRWSMCSSAPCHRICRSMAGPTT